MPMIDPVSDVDPDGLLEYSVVFTDRSLNHMSNRFQHVMRDIHAVLKDVYNADGAVVVPGGGTVGMEAVARQFATDKNVMIVRNGWFSYRWSQIIETGNIAKTTHVMKAARIGTHHQAPFAPPAIEEVVAEISNRKPDIVFAPHVETSSGIMLPDDYIEAIADAVHAGGGLFVLDCIASGAMWVDMGARGVDVLISAPQKGWSSSPSSGLIMLSEAAIGRLAETTSTSFAIDLAKWHQIMQAYLKGGHAYHSTMPTDSLTAFRDTLLETRDYGFEKLRSAQEALGRRVREVLAQKGYASVAARGFEAPGVVVSYTDDPSIQNGSAFAAHGMQVAAGVPLQCDEPEDYSTFRLGLFGLDKLQDVNRAVERLVNVLDAIEPH
ncbi:MAG: aminotransferase class V-fold PLP-dependent enzyme [Pseudomonadota bacterium]